MQSPSLNLIRHYRQNIKISIHEYMKIFYMESEHRSIKDNIVYVDRQDLRQLLFQL